MAVLYIEKTGLTPTYYVDANPNASDPAASVPALAVWLGGGDNGESLVYANKSGALDEWVLLGPKNKTIALTDAATIAWDFSLGGSATVTITTDRAISVTNDHDGAEGYLRITSTSPHSLTLPSGDTAANTGAGILVIPAGVSNAAFKKWGSVRDWVIASNFTTA